MNPKLVPFLLVCASAPANPLRALEVDPRNWAACLPANLRSARSVGRLVDPFAPAGTEPRAKTRTADSDLPVEVSQGLAALERKIKACLVEPAPVLLLGNRIYRPGERIDLPMEAARGESKVRILVQRITEDGAELAVWCETPEGVPVQRDALLRAPGSPSRPKEANP